MQYSKLNVELKIYSFSLSKLMGNIQIIALSRPENNENSDLYCIVSMF